MSAIEAFGLYAGLNGLIILVLSYIVTSHRQRSKISLGVEGDEALLRSSRAQANAVEYTPIALLLLLALALQDAPIYLVHAAGFFLTLARVLHGYGLNMESGRSFGRFFGTLLTWLMILGSAGGAIYLALT